jgi:hypothetical protein
MRHVSAGVRATLQYFHTGRGGGRSVDTVVIFYDTRFAPRPLRRSEKADRRRFFLCGSL